MTFKWTGIESPVTWTAMNHLLGDYLVWKMWRSASSLMIESFRIALESDVIIQAAILREFKLFAAQVQVVLLSKATVSAATREILKNLLDDIMSSQNNTLMNITSDLYFLYLSGIHLQLSGEFIAAENHLRRVLEAPDLATSGLEVSSHYQLMLAIAQQSSRVSEAFQYRRDHQHMIRELESTHGTLEKLIEVWALERNLYDEAKDRISSGDTDWRGEWCREHKEELVTAQTRWGWLYEDAKPWLDPDSDDGGDWEGRSLRIWKEGENDDEIESLRQTLLAMDL